MLHLHRTHAWWVGLLVVVVAVALVPAPTLADDAGDEECGVFPGDGVTGPPLLYQDNHNGTITDRNTGLIWEKKNTIAGSVHNVNNIYTWTSSSGGTTPDGTLFTDFLFQLNNRCAQDETIPCTQRADCKAVGGKCGFAGHRDWRIPNIRELMSIVDYGRCPAIFGPPCVDQAAIDPVFGPTTFDPAAGTPYWSSTSIALNPGSAWFVEFGIGGVFGAPKDETLDDTVRGRAVRRGRCDRP